MGAWKIIELVVLATTTILSSADPGPICDVMNDPDVKYFDVRLPETEVPAQLTTYICHAQPIPISLDVAYHAVAFEPIIMNKDIMHHMLLFGCLKPNSNEPHACSGLDNECRSFLVQWSMGIKGQICSFPNTGVRFGVDSFQSLSLQIHWNNANISKGLIDSSGVRVYYTRRLRQFDLGNVQVGQNDLQIPPGVAHFPQSGSCSSYCTRQILREPIYLSRAHIHLHYVGDGGVLDLIRNGQKVRTIINDTEFDYNSPPYHYFDDPVQVLPGDELKLTCYYNTRDGNKFRNRTIYWNEGSDGEMCYAFITYFPHIRSLVQCIQFDKYDICGLPEQKSIGGCVFEGFTQYFKTNMADDIVNQCNGSSTSRNMRTGSGELDASFDKVTLCSSKCEQAVKEMTEHPCMQNRVGHHLRRVYLQKLDSWEKVKVILDAVSRYCGD